MNNKINGFTSDATLLGVESRSSAPIRFYRDDNMESNIKGIYPIGEGAGYAGGIMSSAIDGLKCMRYYSKERDNVSLFELVVISIFISDGCFYCFDDVWYFYAKRKHQETKLHCFLFWLFSGIDCLF